MNAVFPFTFPGVFCDLRLVKRLDYLEYRNAAEMGLLWKPRTEAGSSIFLCGRCAGRNALSAAVTVAPRMKADPSVKKTMIADGSGCL